MMLWIRVSVRCDRGPGYDSSCIQILAPFFWAYRADLGIIKNLFYAVLGKICALERVVEERLASKSRSSLLFFSSHTSLYIARWHAYDLFYYYFFLLGYARSCNLSYLDPFNSYLLIREERKKPFGLSWNRTQVLLLHKRPL